jgi:hypothetical protein
MVIYREGVYDGKPRPLKIKEKIDKPINITLKVSGASLYF